MSQSPHCTSNIEISRTETAGRQFEIIRLVKEHDYWRCQMAVDGMPAPEFIEPHAHVADLNGEDFLVYMKSQALGMLQYMLESRGMAA